MADPRFVGRTYEGAPFNVTEGSIRSFMRATGDLRPDAELIAPPTYGMVYGFDAYRQLFEDREVGLDMGRLVHGEQSFTLHRPVRPGDRIRTTGRITELVTRGPLELVTFALAARDADGRAVSDAAARFVIRGA